MQHTPRSQAHHALHFHSGNSKHHCWPWHGIWPPLYMHTTTQVTNTNTQTHTHTHTHTYTHTHTHTHAHSHRSQAHHVVQFHRGDNKHNCWPGYSRSTTCISGIYAYMRHMIFVYVPVFVQVYVCRSCVRPSFCLYFFFTDTITNTMSVCQTTFCTWRMCNTNSPLPPCIWIHTPTPIFMTKTTPVRFCVSYRRQDG